MKIFDERKSSAEEISRLLKKKAFDEVELSPPRGGWDGKDVWSKADGRPGRGPHCR